MMGDIVGQKGYLESFGQEYASSLQRHAQTAQLFLGEIVAQNPAAHDLALFLEEKILKPLQTKIIDSTDPSEGKPSGESQ